MQSTERDFLSAISEANNGFHKLLDTERNENKSPKFFEKKFSTAVTKLNLLCETTKVPQCITALMLLSDADVEHSQEVLRLNAAAPHKIMFNDQSSNDEILQSVIYRQLALLVKHTRELLKHRLQAEKACSLVLVMR